MTHNRIANRRGASLIFVILIILIMGLIGAVMVSLVSNESFTALHQTAGLEALGVAEGGMEKAVYQYNNSGTACAALATGAPAALGAGSFTITSTLYSPAPPSILNAGGVTAVAVTIPVVSTAGYAPHGRITIESEDIDYTAITGTSFTGAMRGVNGTTAAGHAAGKHVRQKQCLITATGTVQRPQANAQRKVEASVR